MSFYEEFGDGKTTFVKVNEVARDESGRMAIAYIENGEFKIRLFKDFIKASRTKEEIEAEEISLNDLVGIDCSTMPNQEYSYPFISIVFIDKDKLFVSLFHNVSMTHYHFIYDCGVH
jgi:hypothetical protein